MPEAPLGRFHDRVAIVTGGAGGIGRATAERLLSEGASVALADVDGALVAEVAGQLGERALGVACDVAVGADVERLVGTAIERFGHLDVLVASFLTGSTVHADGGLTARF